MAKEFSDKTDFSKLPERAEEEQVTAGQSQVKMIILKIKDNFRLMKIPKFQNTMNQKTEVDEIVDADGNIAQGDTPGNPNGYIRSKKTSDEVATATMGQMGSFGILGGVTNANKTLKYWGQGRYE